MTQFMKTEIKSQEKESFHDAQCTEDSFLFVDDLITTTTVHENSKNLSFHQQESRKQQKEKEEKLTVKQLESMLHKKDNNDVDENNNEITSKDETNDLTLDSTSCSSQIKDATQLDSSIDTDSKSVSSYSDSSLSSYDSDSSSDVSELTDNDSEGNTDRRNVNPGILDFDQQYSIQPLVILLLHCIGHASFDECFLFLVRSIFEANPINEHVLYFCLLVCGVVLLRCTGGLYSFLSPQQCRRVTYGFKDRMKLFSQQKRRRCAATSKQQQKYRDFKYKSVKVDDNCRKYFKRHRLKRHFVEMIAYYMCYTSICHWNDQLLPMISDMTQEIVDGLPSAQNYNGMESSLSLIGQRLALNNDIELSMSIVSKKKNRRRKIQQQKQKILHKNNMNTDTTTLPHDSFCSQQRVNFSTNRMVMSNSSNLLTMMKNDEERKNIGDNQRTHKKMLYEKDELYLRNKLSVSEYDDFMGDEDHVFFRTRNFLIYYSVLLIASTLALERMFHVSLWWAV